MKIRNIICLLILCNFYMLSNAQQTNVLVLLPDNYGANYFLNRDNFENMGWKVTVAGTQTDIYPCPVYAGPLGCPSVKADTLISQITDVSNYDCIAIMSGSHWAGNPCGNFITDEASLQLLKSANESDIPIAAWCTAVRVLAAANLINGVDVTGNPNYSSEYIAAGANFLGKNVMPVIQGNIITCSAGDYFNKQNCFALLTVLSQKALKKSQNITEGECNEAGKSIIMTNEDSIVISGYKFLDNRNSDILFIKADTLGVKTCEKTIGGSGWELANQSILTSDNHILTVGYTTSLGLNGVNAYAVKTDLDGNVIWEKVFGGDKFDLLNSACEDDLGNYYLCGWTESFGSGQDDIYLIKIDSYGDLVWEKTFGNETSHMAYKVIFSNNSLMIVGNTGRFVGNAGDRDIVVKKLDLNGDLIWDREYKSQMNKTYHERATDITEVSSGNYIITGCHDETYKDVSNIFVLCINPDGNELWRKSLGNGSYYDYGSFTAEITDNYYLVAGVTKSTSTNNNLAFYILSNDKVVETSEILTSEGNDWINSFVLNKDKLLTTGHKPSSDGSNLEALFYSYIPDLDFLNSVNEHLLDQRITILPIPCKDFIHISIDWNQQGTLDFELYNLQGKLVYSQTNISKYEKNIDVDINKNNIEPGIYVGRFNSGNQLITKKLLIAR